MKNIEKHIVSYLNSELDENKINDFESWLKDKNNQKTFKDFVIANHLAESASEQYDSKKAFLSFIKRTETTKAIKPTYKKIYKSFYKYAALVIVTFGILYAVFNQSDAAEFAKISIPNGEKGEVVLPDGTLVQLNSNTTLKYPLVFNSDLREVYLEGEAFFDVVKNTKKPFIVSLSSGIDVKVLGTSFNIKSYPEDSKSETTLFTGKIELLYNEKENIKHTLLPGDRATFRKDYNEIKLYQIKELSEVVAWKNERLLFNAENLKDIVNELNRFFDAQILISDKELENQIFTASFKQNVELNEVLEFLETSGNFKCQKSQTEKKYLLTKV